MAKRFSRHDPKIGDTVYYTELLEGATQVKVVNRFMYNDRKFITAIYPQNEFDFVTAEAKWFAFGEVLEQIVD